jgi:hypothetical protein
LRAVGQEKSAAVVLVGSEWDWVKIVNRAASFPGSSFGNDVTPVTLGPLDESVALAFLVDTAPRDVPIERERTARWIVKLCGTWPFYLQVMGYSVVQDVRSRGHSALVNERRVVELYHDRLLHDRRAVFEGRWKELPPRVQEVLAQHVKTPLDYFELARDVRNLVRDTGLCRENGLWLSDRPFFDWIRRYTGGRSAN